MPVRSAKPAGDSSSAHDRRLADNALRPADSGSNQQPLLVWLVLQHLGELGSHALGGESGSQVQEFLERGTLERLNPELGQQLLLADALLQLAHGGFLRWGAAGRLLDHGFARLV